jgi:tetratricopeptide (TPR) repeat protein
VNHRWRRRLSAVAALVWLTFTAASAQFVRIETRKVPVQRLAENIERQLTQRPDDIQLRLNLARLHAMAYALKVAEFEARSTDGSNLEAWFGHVPRFIPGPVKRTRSAEQIERAKADLARAIEGYRAVIGRAPDNFIAHLGLAWSLEQAGQRVEAIAEYRQVVKLALPVEINRSFMRGQEPATIEAVTRLRALLDPVSDAKEFASLEGAVKELGRVGRMITPILIPLGPTSEPSVSHEPRVVFDADGSGIPRRWTWIRKDAGWLVYDADGRGEITSALQWFGSVTFWLFWNNGYEALAALDDNGDGELHAEELRHLAIWRDANQNGVSEKGEVRSLAGHGIAALSCLYESGDGVAVAAYSRRGVLLGDGSTRPSYDVILRTTGRSTTFTSPLH